VRQSPLGLRLVAAPVVLAALVVGLTAAVAVATAGLGLAAARLVVAGLVAVAAVAWARREGAALVLGWLAGA
jgi:hypothetical protein